MCSAFQTRGVRNASQKSWLVAASRNMMVRPVRPSALIGKPMNLP